MKRVSLQTFAAALVVLAASAFAPAARAQFLAPTNYATGSYSTLNFKVTSATATPMTPAAHGEVILTKQSNGNNYIGCLVFEQLDGLGNVFITVQGQTTTGASVTMTRFVPDTFDNRIYWIQDTLRDVVFRLGGPVPSVSIGTFWAEMIDPPLYDAVN